MKKRLLVLAALVAVFGGASVAAAMSRAHALAPSNTSNQLQDTTADTKEGPDGSEAKATGKPDTDNVQQEDQQGPQDTTNDAPETPATIR